MAIFNSYVKLPEGRPDCPPHWAGWISIIGHASKVKPAKRQKAWSSAGQRRTGLCISGKWSKTHREKNVTTRTQFSSDRDTRCDTHPFAYVCFGYNPHYCLISFYTCFKRTPWVRITLLHPPINRMIILIFIHVNHLYYIYIYICVCVCPNGHWSTLPRIV